jgi:hypothetical protein
MFPVRAWFLPSGEDGTRVSLDANLIFVTADKDVYRSSFRVAISHQGTGFFPVAMKNEVTRFCRKLRMMYTVQ